MSDPARYIESLTQLERTISASWESLAMSLEMHPIEELRNPNDEGSPAWHLIHLVEVFRTHIRHVINDDSQLDLIDFPEQSTQTIPEWIEILHDDFDQFKRWVISVVQDQSDSQIQIEYGTKQSLDEMLGVMLRHIVWHSAAIHYGCLWRNSSAAKE